MDPNGWDCSHRISPFMSLLWRQIIPLYPLLLPYVWLVVGNGKLIKFWDDIWWGDQCLSLVQLRNFRLSNQKDVFVVHVFSPSLLGHSWNLTFIRDLFDWEVDFLAPLLFSVEDIFILIYFLTRGFGFSSLLGDSHANCSLKLWFLPKTWIWPSLPRGFRNPWFPQGWRLSYNVQCLIVLILWMYSKEEDFIWPSPLICYLETLFLYSMGRTHV